MPYCFSLLALLFLVACSSAPQTDVCPQISIPRETARRYYNDGKIDIFQVSLIGTESYCYTDIADNRRYVSLTPIFRLRKIGKTSTASVDADFFVKTSINAENYIGTRKFHQTLSLPFGTEEQVIKGKTTKTRIAMPPYDDFYLTVGLALSPSSKTKADKMFDIDMEYLSGDEEIERKIENVWIELQSDEKIIWSETENKPIAVKKKSYCNNCKRK